MKPNTNPEMYFLGFDTEDNGNHDPYLFALYGDICTSNGEIKHIDLITSDINECIKTLNTPVRDTYLVGFNLSYDLNNIYPQYKREYGTWKGKFSGFKDNSKKIKGLEMMGKWFQGTSLKDLSVKFGVEFIDQHKQTDFNIKGACRSHAKAIYEITKKLERLFNTIGYTMNYGRNMPTASGMAFHGIWKTMTQQQDYHRTWDKSQNVLSGMSYHGGWCDVFNNELQKKVQHYDVCSMYPSVMKGNNYPNPTIPFTKGDLKEFKDILYKKEGFAVGAITTPDILISPFAYRGEHKLYFPIGTWKTSITFPEIRYLLELGGTFECTEFFYTEAWQPFNEYVDKFYTLKKDKQYKEVAKLLLNGLSGKFGQQDRPEGEYIHLKCSPEDVDKIQTGETGIKTFIVCGEEYEYVKPEGVTASYTYYPLISSYITAYSRIKLHRIMAIVGYENMIYCDTDSIVSKVKIPDEYVTKDKTMGLFEHEGEDVDFLAIATKKYKEFRNGLWVYRANGIPKNQQEVFWKNPATPIKYKHPLSFKQALRMHKLPNQWVDVIKISCPEQKRKFSVDGSSQPFRAEDL